LDLLEGVLIDLLKTKWNTFVKAKFYQQFYCFSIYFFISLFAFLLRPRAFGDGDDDNDAAENGNSTQTDVNVTTNAPVKSLFVHNLTEILCNYSATYADAIMQAELSMMNSSLENSTLPMDDTDEWSSFSECPLLDISTIESRVRTLYFLSYRTMLNTFFSFKIKLSAEALMTIGALLYILTALREARFLGAKMFFENLVRKLLNLSFSRSHVP
jgi:transient receptor potential cation channel subfamily V protein 5